MKGAFSAYTIVIVLVIAVSCDSADVTMQFAGENAIELQKLRTRYADSVGIKRLAAEFIVNNIAGHYYGVSSAISAYRDLVIASKEPPVSSIMRQWWDSLKTDNHMEIRYDAQELSCQYLSDNIEHAARIWLQTPWCQDIDKSIFLDYVLPYRVKDEPPSCIGWRDSLYRRYHHIIEGVTDIRAAFGKVHRYLMDEFKIHDIGEFPYLLSAMDAGRMLQGRCIHRCSYVVAVMRSLGIPAALDVVDSWANISTAGHSWVALVTDDGTYTVERGDSTARQYAPIDASIFYIKDTLEADYPLDVSFRKRVSAIWRHTYSWNMIATDYNDTDADYDTAEKFHNPFTIDVTEQYGFCKTITFFSPRHRGYAYLCTFRTGCDWMPVRYAYSSVGCFMFSCLPDSVIFLPAYFDNGTLRAFDSPFAMTHEGIKEFNADTTLLQTMTIDRKYPLSLNSVKSWPQARGACVEASNDRSFREADTLYIFQRTPLFRNVVKVIPKKKYQYVRYRSHPLRHAYISEIETYSYGQRLRGKVYAEGVSNPNAVNDGDSFSFLDKVQPGSWVSIDFDYPITIDSLVIYPKNDGNHVIEGKYYELWCYVGGQWKKYGASHSRSSNLTFLHVPSCGIYRLHCLDGGIEEQIFSYENNRQVWW